MQDRRKWMEQISEEDSVSSAARSTLKSRLKTVAHFLELATTQADETTEHVHQLRVATRRSVAALCMYEEVLPKKQRKWFHKHLRRIRKAAGDARDLDVFMQRYENETDPQSANFLRQLKKRRLKAQKPILKLHANLIADKRFKKRVGRLLKSIRSDSKSGDQTLVAWARSRFDDVSDEFVEAIPACTGDLEALHRFRVRGKELRYAMELFANLFPPEFRVSLYPMVTQLQEQLGAVNDHATACRFLERWKKRSPSNGSPSQCSADFLGTLIDREQQQLAQAIKRFSDWWTPALGDELKALLLRATSNDTHLRGSLP